MRARACERHVIARRPLAREEDEIAHVAGSKVTRVAGEPGMLRVIRAAACSPMYMSAGARQPTCRRQVASRHSGSLWFLDYPWSTGVLLLSLAPLSEHVLYSKYLGHYYSVTWNAELGQHREVLQHVHTSVSLMSRLSSSLLVSFSRSPFLSFSRSHRRRPALLLLHASLPRVPISLVPRAIHRPNPDHARRRSHILQVGVYCIILTEMK